MMLDLIEEGDANLIDAALCCLRTLAHKDCGNGRTVYTQNQVQRLLSYAEPNEMLMRQSCVASILSDFCKRNAEQVCISTTISYLRFQIFKRKMRLRDFLSILFLSKFLKFKKELQLPVSKFAYVGNVINNLNAKFYKTLKPF